MDIYEILKLRDHDNLLETAANWFSSKWNVPIEAYIESMEQCLLNTTAVPQWYITVKDNTIIAGLGVIENDFHSRVDLTPNICAVYVDEPFRCQGIAGEMLNYACTDMQHYGINTLYLVTDHTSFYERYGWNFLCLVQGSHEGHMTRMYIHQT